MELPHGRSSNVLEDAWKSVRAWLRGPLGCLVMILCFPFALLALLVAFVVLLWKGRGLRKAIQGQIDAERDTGDALATAALVRSLALDDSFTREEAERTAVPAGAGKSAAELLDDAIRRGWVEESGGRMSVTPAGRERAEAILRARGV